MEYILCEFIQGLSGRFYQEVENGNVVRLTDLDGNTIVPIVSYSAIVVDVNPERPSWAL